MPQCGVMNCRVNQGKMFAFPKDDVLQKQWLVACRRQEGTLNCNSTLVCKRHFTKDCIKVHFTKSSKQILKLKTGSIPTMHLELEKPHSNIKRSFNYWSEVKKLKDGPPKKLPRTGIPSYNELIQSFIPSAHNENYDIQALMNTSSFKVKEEIDN